MTREHLLKPIQDEAGNLQPGSSVRLLEPGTTTPIAETIYVDGTSDIPRTNPWVTDTGVADFYLDKAKTVRIGVITPGAAAEIFFEDVEIGEVGGSAKETYPFTIAGTVSVQTGRLRFYVEDPSEIQRVRCSVGVAPVGADLKIDVNLNGSSIFTSDPAPVVLDGTFTAYIDLTTPIALAPGDYLTIDVDQVGSTTPGADLVVQVRVQRD